MTDHTGRIVLVTGASRGIGYAAAKHLAAAGAHVIATARTQGGLEDLDDEIKASGGQCTLVPMDLKDGDSIDRLGKALHERFGKIDGLLLNAAQLDGITPMPHIKPADWDSVISVNLTANYRLIRALDPLLRASDAGRVVAVTSSVAQSHLAYWGAYAVSKAGLEAMTNIYAKETEITPVRVNIYDPSGTRTAMRAKAVPGEDASQLPDPAEHWPNLSKLLSDGFKDTGKLVTFSG
jgi:NAD(P)-dependent dehydrogenase (short-subunit alcohol dehydrogenase family)